VLSSYSDLSKLSSNLRAIHFRKYVSKRILFSVIEACPCLEVISLSGYASKRLSSNILKIIFNRQIELRISKMRGRPIALAPNKNINMSYKL
jgi:hypothetical protein